MRNIDICVTLVKNWIRKPYFVYVCISDLYYYQKTQNLSKTLIPFDIVKIIILVFWPIILSWYAFSRVDYINWIYSFILLVGKKPWNRKKMDFRLVSCVSTILYLVEAMSCKGKPDWEKFHLLSHLSVYFSVCVSVCRSARPPGHPERPQANLRPG